MKMMLVLYFFSFQLFSYENIKLLNWWDYLSSQVSQELNQKYPELLLTEYRSNEVALSKLLNHNSEYDIAIVSNWVAKKLKIAGRIENKALQGILTKRKYEKSILLNSVNCLPFLWSTTLFVQKKNLGNIDNIYKLLDLKKLNKKIGIIDDSVEFVSRLVLDSDRSKNCSLKFDINNCLKRDLTLSKDDFNSSFTRTIQKYDAAYTWHGVVSNPIESLNEYKYTLPLKAPIIGGDYLCVLKNEKRKFSELQKIIDIATFITNKRNTYLNSSFTYYFSPYVNDSGDSLPAKTKNLHSKIKKMLKNKKVHFIKDYNSHEIEVINSFWKEKRFHQ